LWAAVGVEAATGAAPGTRLQARQALDPSRSSQRPSRVGTGSGMQAPRRCRWTATMLAVSPSGSGKTAGLRRCTTSSPIAVATRNVSLMCPPPKGRTAPTPAANHSAARRASTTGFAGTTRTVPNHAATACGSR